MIEDAEHESAHIGARIDPRLDRGDVGNSRRRRVDVGHRSARSTACIRETIRGGDGTRVFAREEKCFKDFLLVGGIRRLVDLVGLPDEIGDDAVFHREPVVHGFFQRIDIRSQLIVHPRVAGELADLPLAGIESDIGKPARIGVVLRKGKWRIEGLCKHLHHLRDIVAVRQLKAENIRIFFSDIFERADEIERTVQIPPRVTAIRGPDDHC